MCWRNELGQQLQLVGPTAGVQQIGTCEQAFLAGVQEDATNAALAFAQKVFERGQAYIQCKFSSGTAPQAQAIADWAAIFGVCLAANLPTLLRKDYGGFMGGLVGCLAGKLLEGGGSSPTPAPAAYNPNQQHRCGQ